MITGLSDHNLTLVVRKLTKKRFSHQTINRKTWNFRIPKSDLNNLKRALEDIKWEEHFSQNCVERDT